MFAARPAVPLAVLLAVTAGPGAWADDAGGVVNSECGYYCLAAGLGAFPDAATGGDADPAALRARLGEPGREGYSLEELRAAAEAAGFHAAPVRTTLPALRARSEEVGERFAAVAHVDGNHYVLLSGFEPGGAVRVVDPSADPLSYALPAETFAARWDGAALLVSPDPLTPEEDLPAGVPWWAWGLAAAGVGVLLALAWSWRSGRSAAAAGLLLACALPAGCGGAGAGETPDTPALPPAGPKAVFAEVVHDLGEVPAPSAGRTAVFTVRNAGDAPLRLGTLRLSCNCTDAVASAAPIPPGGETTVAVTVSPDRPEKRSPRVVVPTNDPAASEVGLEVRWHAVGALTPDPLELDFGTLRPGAGATRTVRLVRRDLGGPAPEAGEPAARGAAGRSGDAPIVVEAATAGGFTVRLTAPADDGPGGAVVTVPLTGGAAGGPSHLRVPVRWVVRDLAGLTPARLSFAAVGPGAETVARAIVAGDGPLSPAGPVTFTPDDPDAWQTPPVAAVTRLTAERWAVDLSGPAPAATGRHTGTLVVPVEVAGPGGGRRTLTAPASVFVLGGPPA